MTKPSQSGPSERREVLVGRHVAAFEPPDTFLIRQVGDFTTEDVAAYCDALDGLVAGRTPLYAIVDQAEAGKVTAEGRKMIVARMPPATVGVVFINLSALARIGMSLGYKAYVMMTHGRELPHAFVNSAEEARAWIAEQRKRRAASGPGSP